MTREAPYTATLCEMYKYCPITDIMLDFSISPRGKPSLQRLSHWLGNKAPQSNPSPISWVHAGDPDLFFRHIPN